MQTDVNVDKTTRNECKPTQTNVQTERRPTQTEENQTQTDAERRIRYYIELYGALSVLHLRYTFNGPCNTHPRRDAGLWAQELLLDLLGTKRWWPSVFAFPDRYTYTPVGEGSWDGYCLVSGTSDGIEFAVEVFRKVLAKAPAYGWGGANLTLHDIHWVFSEIWKFCNDGGRLRRSLREGASHATPGVAAMPAAAIADGASAQTRASIANASHPESTIGTIGGGEALHDARRRACERGALGQATGISHEVAPLGQKRVRCSVCRRQTLKKHKHRLQSEPMGCLGSRETAQKARARARLFFTRTRAEAKKVRKHGLKSGKAKGLRSKR